MTDKLSLKDSLAGLRQSQAEPQQIELEKGADKPKQLARSKTKAAPIRVPGKSRHPDFEKVGVYVRTETRRKAERKWQDQSGGDLSDLIETLLSKFAGA